MTSYWKVFLAVLSIWLRCLVVLLANKLKNEVWKMMINYLERRKSTDSIGKIDENSILRIFEKNIISTVVKNLPVCISLKSTHQISDILNRFIASCLCIIYLFCYVTFGKWQWNPSIIRITGSVLIGYVNW